MGYEVDVSGPITFINVKGFIKNFPYDNSDARSVNTEGFYYFFTKVWGDKLEELKDVTDGQEFHFTREGKSWYDVEKAMNYLAKYATFELIFQGEEREDRYKYVSKNGKVEYYECEMQWVKK
jgi:hypothetical protein